MASRYRFGNPEQPHFISFAVVNWIDALSRIEYKDILVTSLKYCIDEKGLILYAWVIMNNHVHLVASTVQGNRLENIMRDLKKFTSRQVTNAIRSNSNESRREWMLWMFERAAKRNKNNQSYQFWQQDNHPIECFTWEMLQQKVEYVHENPVKAGLVFEAWQYPYSSAVSYQKNGSGMLPISFIY